AIAIEARLFEAFANGWSCTSGSKRTLVLRFFEQKDFRLVGQAQGIKRAYWEVEDSQARLRSSRDREIPSLPGMVNGAILQRSALPMREYLSAFVLTQVASTTT